MIGTAGEVAELSEEEVLAAAEACADTIREAEAELLMLAHQWAVLHGAGRLDPADDSRPGRERAKRYGGPGTPQVGEFAAAELGVRIGRSPYAAAQLIADALDLHHRLPRHWTRVRAGEVRASYARHVATRTRELTPVQAGYVDAAVAESADGRIPWSRFEALVEAKVAQADPETTRAREEAASRATFAKKLRGQAHGMATFMVRADVATIDQLDAAVTLGAHELEATMPEADLDTRRVHAVLLLAHPGATVETDLRDLMPRVTLYLHQYLGPDTEPIARLEDHGPVTEAWITRVLGPGAGSRSSPSSTSRTRPRSTPTRSPTDIDRPCT